jgi:hypothetical protein
MAAGVTIWIPPAGSRGSITVESGEESRVLEGVSEVAESEFDSEPEEEGLSEPEVEEDASESEDGEEEVGRAVGEGELVSDGRAEDDREGGVVEVGSSCRLTMSAGAGTSSGHGQADVRVKRRIRVEMRQRRRVESMLSG